MSSTTGSGPNHTQLHATNTQASTAHVKEGAGADTFPQSVSLCVRSVCVGGGVWPTRVLLGDASSLWYGLVGVDVVGPDGEEALELDLGPLRRHVYPHHHARRGSEPSSLIRGNGHCSLSAV